MLRVANERSRTPVAERKVEADLLPAGAAVELAGNASASPQRQRSPSRRKKSPFSSSSSGACSPVPSVRDADARTGQPSPHVQAQSPSAAAATVPAPTASLPGRRSSSRGSRCASRSSSGECSPPPGVPLGRGARINRSMPAPPHYTSWHAPPRVQRDPWPVPARASCPGRATAVGSETAVVQAEPSSALAVPTCSPPARNHRPPASRRSARKQQLAVSRLGQLRHASRTCQRSPTPPRRRRTLQEVLQLVHKRQMGMVSPGDKLCVFSLNKCCGYGSKCKKYHPQGAARERIVQLFKEVPCRFSTDCWNPECIFWHPEGWLSLTAAAPERRMSGSKGNRDDTRAVASRSRGRSRSRGNRNVMGASVPHPHGTFSGEGAGQRGRGLGTASCSSSPRSESNSSIASASSQSSSSAGNSTAEASVHGMPLQRFPDVKFAPAVFLSTKDFVLLSKPAGWSAGLRRETFKSSKTHFESEEHIVASGHVEPVHTHPEFTQFRKYLPVLAVGASVSGFALAARGKHAKRRMTKSLRMGQLTSVAIALVEGEPDPARPIAVARREDGFFEVFVLAVYTRVAQESVQKCMQDTAETSNEHAHDVRTYTLVLMKATGSACSSERYLLNITWCKPALGDVEHGGQEAESWFGNRPFFHTCALTASGQAAVDLFGPPSSGGLGWATSVCPLPPDLRSAFQTLLPKEASFCATGQESAESIRVALVQFGQLPPRCADGRGMQQTASTSVPALPQPQDSLLAPEPFGAAEWQDSGVSRRHWILAFVREALLRWSDYELEQNDSGAILVKSLFGKFAGLADACFRRPGVLQMAIKRDPSSTLKIDISGRYVWLCTVFERLQGFVEAYTVALPPGHRLPIAELLANQLVHDLLREHGLLGQPFLECLQPSPYFDIEDVEATTIVLRPLCERILLGIERLMTEPTGDLTKQMFLGRGTVSLAWLLGTYSHMLSGTDTPPPISVAVSALSSSKIVEVDPATFAVRLRTDNLQVTPATFGVVPYDGPQVVMNPQGTIEKRLRRPPPRKHANAKSVKTLVDVLEFYFSPFFIQHCRLLLHTADEEAENGVWRWPFMRIARNFTRVGDLVLRLPAKDRKELLAKVFEEPLQHVRFVPGTDEGVDMLELTYEPDFRMPVIAVDADPWVSDLFIDTVDGWTDVSAPSCVIMSYALGRAEGLGSAGDAGVLASEATGKVARGRWHRMLLRQLLAYRADVLCLQQCEAELSGLVCSEGVGASSTCVDAVSETMRSHSGGRAHDDSTTLFAALRERLAKEDFEWCAAPACRFVGENVLAPTRRALAVFWRRSKWRAVAVHAGAGGALRVTLCPRKGPNMRFDVGCLEASDLMDLWAQVHTLSDTGSVPAVLCGSFGASPEKVGEALKVELSRSRWRSAHPEVLGAEMPWTTVSSDSHLSATDGIWLGGGSQIKPLAALAGCRMGPPRSADGKLDRQALPTDHLPLVVALDQSLPTGMAHMSHAGA